MTLLAVGFFNISTAPSHASSIDSRLVEVVDVTGDGEGDEISVRLRAKDILSPFSWELSINSRDHILLKHESDDTWMNSFFGEPGYMGGCAGYIECKQKYYFNDLIKNIVVPYSMVNIDGIVDAKSIYPIASKYLQENSISAVQIERIIPDLQARIKAERAVFLTVPISPLMTRGLLVYSPIINKLVLVYED